MNIPDCNYLNTLSNSTLRKHELDSNVGKIVLLSTDDRWSQDARLAHSLEYLIRAGLGFERVMVDPDWIGHQKNNH